jgi:hypothetical protein
MSVTPHHTPLATCESQGPVSVESKETPPPKGADPLLLAFYYLLQASNIANASAVAHAKQMNQNAEAQQSLNNQLAAFHNTNIPQLQKKSSWTDWKQHWTWSFWNHSWMFVYFTRDKIVVTLNGEQVNQAQYQNQEIAAQRQIICNQMNGLEQQSEVSETHVSNIANQAMEGMQIEGDVLQMLKSLTYKVLMRQPPS